MPPLLGDRLRRVSTLRPRYVQLAICVSCITDTWHPYRTSRSRLRHPRMTRMVRRNKQVGDAVYMYRIKQDYLASVILFHGRSVLL